MHTWEGWTAASGTTTKMACTWAEWCAWHQRAQRANKNAYRSAIVSWRACPSCAGCLKQAASLYKTTIPTECEAV